MDNVAEIVANAEEYTPLSDALALTSDRIRNAGVGAKPCSIGEVEAVYRRWLGDNFDTGPVQAALATAAAEKLDGDPLWTLIVGAPGSAKTESIAPLQYAGAVMVSTISSEGALLSATSKRSVDKNATGGLLRQLGEGGLLLLKDVTSILAMNRDSRASVLAALREIYDGQWTRHVGVDGGKTLEWSGRIGIVGAVTTAWDDAYEVVGVMGPRFVLFRFDSTEQAARMASGWKAIANTGHEGEMRGELGQAVAGLINGIDAAADYSLTDAESLAILRAANVATLARTAVQRDYRGDVINAHAPEAPTRFAKQLTQVMRGGMAIGLSRAEALALAVRGARDSMPPLRLAILEDVVAHPGTSTTETRRRLGKPRASVDRELQALHVLELLDVHEEEQMVAARPATVWRYQLRPEIDLDSLAVPDLSVQEELGVKEKVHPTTDISGTGGCIVCGTPLRDPTSRRCDRCVAVPYQIAEYRDRCAGGCGQLVPSPGHKCPPCAAAATPVAGERV